MPPSLTPPFPFPDSSPPRCSSAFFPPLLTALLLFVPLLLAALLFLAPCCSVTLSIFPGVLAEDVHSAELGSWYPVGLITLFNLADCAGKAMPGLPQLLVTAPNTLLTCTLVRVLFVPAFHLAAIDGGPVAVGCLTVLLGVSNGWLTACCMMAAPEGMRGRAAALAGNLMVFSLVLGLCIGAGLGFLWLL